MVSTGAPAYALSFAAGRIVSTNTVDTFADGIACRAPWQVPLDIIREGADRIVEVDDAEIASAMRAYYQDTHNIACGAGAAPLAALVKERERMAGRKVGLILSGGNVQLPLFMKLMADQRNAA